jgi:excisionase family DNA binding protein
MRTRVPDNWLLVADVAKLKDVSSIAVRHMIYRKRLRAIKIGTQWALPKSDAERYLQMHKGRPRLNGKR